MFSFMCKVSVMSPMCSLKSCCEAQCVVALVIAILAVRPPVAPLQSKKWPKAWSMGGAEAA